MAAVELFFRNSLRHVLERHASCSRPGRCSYVLSRSRAPNRFASSPSSCLFPSTACSSSSSSSPQHQRRQYVSSSSSDNANATGSDSSKPRKKRMSYRIAAASSGKTGGGFTIPRNVRPFNPGIHDAIGRQEGETQLERRRSRPDSGQDAFFVSKVGRRGEQYQRGKDGGSPASTPSTPMEDTAGVAFGVADGVGGWIEHGTDPADFAHALVTYMADSALGWTRPSSSLHPRDLIEMAYAKSLDDILLVAGGSTANVGMAWDDGRVELANLGDSGSLLFRNAAIQHHSPPQTHAFNTPYQLTIVPPPSRLQRATFGRGLLGDQPSDADRTTLDLQHGDVLVLATDGVLDNLFRRDLLRLVTTAMLMTGAWESVATGSPIAALPGVVLDAVTRPGGLALEEYVEKRAVDEITRTKGKTSSPDAGTDTGSAALSSIAPYGTCQSLLALSIAAHSIAASRNTTRDSPFTREARSMWPEERWYGGKIDDITTVVVVAVDESLTR